VSVRVSEESLHFFLAKLFISGRNDLIEIKKRSALGVRNLRCPSGVVFSSNLSRDPDLARN